MGPDTCVDGWFYESLAGSFFRRRVLNQPRKTASAPGPDTNPSPLSLLYTHYLRTRIAVGLFVTERATTPGLSIES